MATHDHPVRHLRMIALGDARLIALRCDNRELDFQLAAGAFPCELEADRLEDAEHSAVIAHHLGEEALDAVRGCASRELLEESSPMPRRWNASATEKATSATARSRRRT